VTTSLLRSISHLRFSHERDLLTGIALQMLSAPGSAEKRRDAEGLAGSCGVSTTPTAGLIIGGLTRRAVRADGSHSKASIRAVSHTGAGSHAQPGVVTAVWMSCAKVRNARMRVSASVPSSRPYSPDKRFSKAALSGDWMR
jgi:hypothetical protein